MSIINHPTQINYLRPRAGGRRCKAHGSPAVRGCLPEPAGQQGHAAAAAATLHLFKFSVAEVRTQLQVLMSGLVTCIKNLEECLEDLCVVVQQGKGRKEISLHLLPWYRLSPTKGFPK